MCFLVGPRSVACVLGCLLVKDRENDLERFSRMLCQLRSKCWFAVHRTEEEPMIEEITARLIRNHHAPSPASRRGTLPLRVTLRVGAHHRCAMTGHARSAIYRSVIR